MSFVAGPYTGTYNDLALGETQDGFDLDITQFGQPITGDNLGSAHQDSVYRAGNYFLGWQMQEWDKAGALAAYSPWAAFGVAGQVGRLATNVAQDIVLTVVAGTTADTAGPNTLTAPLAILASDFNVKHFFSTRHRSLPLRHQLFPHISSSYAAAYWFTTT